ncbi:MAG: DMT family transporter [Pseudohongiella sp.]|jgi:drug/metabolite transporter (DMT)-like permease|nr:DMT family transporter [Pseudohongiella sp.]
MKTVILTTLALIAFAANSVLCRLALGGGTIDAASFTVIRLIAGIIVLFIIAAFAAPLIAATPSKSESIQSRGSWQAGAMLFLYAVTFSFAYISLDTGTGALILFGSVQITMILWSLITGTRLQRLEWAGVVVAFAGFVYLVMPGVSAPSLTGFLLMTSAGIAWGIYTLKGRGSASPLMDTTFNFVRTIPFLLILLLLTFQQAELSMQGAVLASLSGGLASGVGYTIWYSALRGLSSTQAAVVQLSVPIIAAMGGVVIVSEPITARLLLSTCLILGGIVLVIYSRYQPQRA